MLSIHLNLGLQRKPQIRKFTREAIGLYFVDIREKPFDLKLLQPNDYVRKNKPKVSFPL